MKKVLTCTGIRPDFIRMSEVFRKLDAEFDHILVHTGQHYDQNLSDIFFKDLDIRKPDYNLSVGAPDKPHYEQVADLSVKLTKLCLQEKPDLIIFLGDSNSVLASIPLKKEGFKVAHIEAGMRSWDSRMLEEVNRVACDHVSDLLFVYHNNYRMNLVNENINRKKIHVVGNTIVETLRNIADIEYRPPPQHIILDIHRPENFKYKNRMSNILYSARQFKEIFGLPVKMLSFPRTEQAICNFRLDMTDVERIPMMGYKDYIKFQQESLFIYSDSGTAQDEPCLLGKPAIVPRDYTERPESCTTDCSRMIGVEMENFYEQVLAAAEWIQSHSPAFRGDTSWLGDGTTSQKIVDVIKKSI